MHIVVNHGSIAFDDTPRKVYTHYQELEKIGLAAPQITYIMHALKEKGLHEILMQQLWRRLQRIF